jgi:hypothetical protein
VNCVRDSDSGYGEWGSARCRSLGEALTLREAAATPPEGRNNINGLHDVSAMRARLGDSRPSTQGHLMSFHPSGGVAAASLSVSASPSERQRALPHSP